MQRKEILDFISVSGMNLDMNTINQAANFLETHIGSLTPNLSEYEIFSATAIVGQTMMIHDITETRRAKSGITLEYVMRHIGKLSKEQYLDVLTRQVTKWREAPLWLKTKTENLKFTYRVYKKYRSVFDELCNGNTFLDQKSRFNLMAIFWIVYLYIKNENSQFENILESTSLLQAIILFTFAQVSAQLSYKQSSSNFRKQFPENPILTVQKLNHLKLLILKKLNEIHSYRYENQQIILQSLATDFNFTQRYLDDISNLYQKFRARLPENSINEISFLQLTKNLTPMLIKRSDIAISIQQKIDFDHSDDDEMSIQPTENNIRNEEDTNEAKIVAEKPKNKPLQRRQPVSPFRPYTSIGSATPISTRHQNLGWVNGINSKVILEQTNQVKKIYQQYTKKDYGKYYQQALSNINNAICEFTPECMDFTKRQRSIYHFFEYFINRIAEAHVQAEKMAIFGQDNNFNSILCLATDLFNYAYQSLEASYRKYCKIFKITLLQGHKPINWFGKHLKIPRNIQNYLYQLQKKILIQQIWYNNEGYLLLSNEEQLKKYHNQALLRRMQRHVVERTQQLCDKMKIEQKEVSRVVNLVKFILQKRPILLKNHRIDQIIVCSIASILSINFSRSKFSLEEIFNYYNQLIYSFYSNKNSLFDHQGNNIDLIGYYNTIFLPSIEEIINNEDHAEILATPIRLDRKKSKEMGIQMTPIPTKFRQIPNFSFPSFKTIQMTSQRAQKESGNQVFEMNSYRSQLAHSLRNLDSFPEEHPEENEDPPSPTFGLSRTMSFGNCPKFQ